MLRRRNNNLVILTVAVSFAFAATLGTARAQKAPVPKPQDKLVLAEEEVKQLLLLMGTDKNGKVSKQVFMRFMEAEFERLDTNHDGELDVKELTKSQMRVHRAYVGK